MKYLCNDKLVILGAGGMIGSNLMQTALTMGLTPNVCGYDPFEPGLKGATEEIYHCAFPGARVTWTTDIKEALSGAKYVVSSGGAPRKDGMTREDLLRGNAEIAVQLGKDLRAYAPDLKFAVIIFNPADITGLIALVHSGLNPSCISTLAALDSSRLQTALAQHFKVQQDQVTGCRTYGGHGEQMAVFASTTKIAGKPLSELIGTDKLTHEQWNTIKGNVVQGGKAIIQLRGRSSFQSPSHQSLAMVRAVMGGDAFEFPSGSYVYQGEFKHILMAMETTLDSKGVHYKMPTGTEAEMAELRVSYGHLCKLRDEVIGMGLLPPTDQWSSVNKHL
jgi:malate dehydrogenase